ncbi:MAG: sensor histidine kinase [Clostridia bacterium]|nr:sensor histidine kinase [Clostridia bacterium]
MEKNKLIISPLQRRLLLLAILPVLMTAIVLTIGAASVSLNTSQSMLENQLKTVAFMLSSDGNVAEGLTRGKMADATSAYLDSILTDNNSIDIISIANMQGIRVYHNNKDMIGQHFVGGDENRAYQGESYASTATGTMGLQMRYFVPIMDHEGEQIGFVMASSLISRVQAQERHIIRTLVSLVMVLLVPCIVLAIGSADRIRKVLMGYEPEQIAQILAEREDVFESLDEGLLAVDVEGNVLLSNAAACRFLDNDAQSLRGEKIKQSVLKLPLEQTIRTGKESGPDEITLHGFHLICEYLPILSKDKCIGAVAVLHDETRMQELAKELTGVNHFIESLRANQHEFMNKLHVILGLLQVGEVDAAKDYITRLSDHENGVSQGIVRQIENRTVAAMLLGKMAHGHELGIEINLSPNSYLPHHSAFLSTDSLITVLGNTIENSIEAIDSARLSFEEEDGQIDVMIHEDTQALMVTVDDNGPGIPESQLNRIFVRGFTTKGSGHGNGLAAVQRIIRDADGEITVDSHEGEGTSISIFLRKRRERR